MVRKDEAPIKMLRGKYRYHILIKAIDHEKVKPLYEFLSDRALEENEEGGNQVYFELNPSTMV